MTQTLERRVVHDGSGTDAAPPSRPVAHVGRALIVVTAIVWLLSLRSLGHATLSQYGLLATASPLFLASIVLAVPAFVACVRARDFRASVAALVLMAVVQRVPTSLATAVPLYSWTYKHLGVVDYIRQHGQLAHGIDVYQGWPGLFAVTAWFSDLTGVKAVTLAHWFTPVLHLALLGLVYVLARAWDLDPFPALVASFLVEALNWVAQDYYSPQATALVLALGVLIVMGASRERAVGAPALLVIFAALVITHQLTPYWLMIAGVLLALTRRLQPRWLILAMIFIAGAFLAFNWDTASHFSLLSLNPIDNAKSNVPTVGVIGQQVTSKVVRAMSVTLWLSAFICAVADRRRRTPVLGRGVLALSAFLLLGGQGYGGEAIFRVFLYSLFGCALLVAPALTRAISARPPMLGIATVVVVMCVVASAQGFYGSWFADRMSKAQVTEADSLLNTAAFPGFLTVAAPVWPERSTGRYVTYAEVATTDSQTYDYPMIYAAKLTGTDFSTAAEYRAFIRVVGLRTAPTYLIITRQMAIYDWYFGILPLGALDNLEARMRQDPRWKVYRSTSSYVIFKSTPALIGASK